MLNLRSWGPATVLLTALVAIIALTGAVVTIAHPDTLSFADYLKALEGAAVAVAGLSIGRGVHLGGQALGQAQADAVVRSAVAATSTEVPGLSEGIKAEGFEPPMSPTPPPSSA